MNLREKRKFVRELIKNVQVSIEDRLVDTPDSWDGHELRRYIADSFNRADMGLCSKKPYTENGTTRARRRDYENEVLIKNL